ncbi:MAG: DUF3037 domain-containing protein [Planctomycetota bacterium]|nr:DUF3037 domain-containing protein [Planctomycetota bacterium]
MPSYYTIVQYVPDPIADERINVGVIVFRGELVKTRFVTSWRRARSFGDQDIAFLREFVDQFQEEPSTQLRLPGMEETVRINEKALREISNKWINSIQLTEPRASLQEPEALLSDMSERFLRQEITASKPHRDRRTAVRMAAESIESALVKNLGEQARQYLKRRSPVRGTYEEHVFDVAVVNGGTMLAVQGISFEGPDSEELLEEVHSVAWKVDDVRREQKELPLAVFALPPSNGSKSFELAKRICEGLGADFVTEADAENWATGRVGSPTPNGIIKPKRKPAKRTKRVSGVKSKKKIKVRKVRWSGVKSKKKKKIKIRKVRQ